VTILFAVLNTLFKEAILVVLLLWLLPQMGIRLPLWLIVAVLAAPVAWAALTYKSIRRVLRKKAPSPTEAMVGMRGTALTRLAPKGMVRIQGEIWEAASSNGFIEAGSEVIVLRTEGLEITVRKAERETQ
jgi:membrane-bound ClpP family serine protease